MSNNKENFRVEQKELHEWLMMERGDRTLTDESVEYLLNKMLDGGYWGLECLKTATSDELLKMGLNDEQVTWLERWKPKNNRKSLEG